MIFSNLFKPKHRHTDPIIRIQAIEAMSATDGQNKSILHELAFNDEDGRVSVAALNKLNNFDLWWKMAEIAKDTRVAKHAKQKVEAALLGDLDLGLTSASKNTFLKECRNNALLELLLQKHAIDESNTELMLGVLAKLNKPQTSMRYLLNSANSELQNRLFDNVEDESELGKIIKKCSNDELVEKAKQKLAAKAEAEQKPIQISKDVKLVLAKLLALTEEANYDRFASVRNQLETQFAHLKSGFSYLADEISSEFADKYTALVDKLDKRAAMLKGEWDEQQALERTSAALAAAKDTCRNVLDKVADALSKDAANITLGQLEQFNQQIAEAEHKLNAMLSEKLSSDEYKGIEKLINDLLVSKSSLDSLPALQQAISQAETMLEQFKSLPLPDDFSQIDAAYEYLDEVKERWGSLRNQHKAIWPMSIESLWQEQIKQWQKSIRQLKDELRESTNAVKGRMNAIKRMVEQGRYRNAMRTYEKLCVEYQQLPEVQQARLTRQFDTVKDEIENLKDWQAYIATPRKPEMLREIEQLVLNPIDPSQQAERVKELRKEWNSLGTIDSEADEAMNKAFNLACEEAFKPCREYYAELEAKRESNLKDKQSLLDELANFDGTDLKALAKKLRDVQHQWKAIGGVDYKVLDELNERYRAVINPVKDKVSQFHQQNAESKQALLEQAKSLLDLDNWQEATNAAKNLQDKWRKLEFAGQKLENKLWADFRAINDQIFAKRDNAIAEQNEQDLTAIKAVTDKVESLQSVVEQSSSRSELEEVVNVSLNDALKQLQEFPKKLSADAIASVKTLSKKAQEKLLYLGDSQRTEVYQKVFATLAAWNQHQAPDSASELPNFWRQAFHSTDESEDGLNVYTRHELTILIEMEKSIESPDADQALRKEVHLKLMASKLQEGVHVELDELLRAWIVKGQVHQAEQSWLSRIEPAFL